MSADFGQFILRVYAARIGFCENVLSFKLRDDISNIIGTDADFRGYVTQVAFDVGRFSRFVQRQKYRFSVIETDIAVKVPVDIGWLIITFNIKVEFSSPVFA